MSTARSNAAQEAANMSQNNAERWSALAMPYASQRAGILRQALRGQGVPSLAPGFQAQRSAATEQALAQERAQQPGGTISPVQNRLPALLAQSGLTQHLAALGQHQDIVSAALGGASQYGQNAVQAGGMNAAAVNQMSAYSPAQMYGSALGSLGWTAYGLANQPGKVNPLSPNGNPTPGANNLETYNINSIPMGARSYQSVPWSIQSAPPPNFGYSGFASPPYGYGR